MIQTQTLGVVTILGSQYQLVVEGANTLDEATKDAARRAFETIAPKRGNLMRFFVDGNPAIALPDAEWTEYTKHLTGVALTRVTPAVDRNAAAAEAPIPALLPAQNHAGAGEELPARPSRRDVAQPQPPRQPGSYAARFSRFLDIVANHVEQKVEREWVDHREVVGWAAKAIHDPVQFADTLGMYTAQATNFVGTPLALLGGLGRIISSVIAAVLRTGVFAIAATAYYACELVIGAIVLGCLVTWFALEALAVVALGSLDLGVALTMLALAFLSRFLLVDIWTNKTIDAEKLLGFAGYCHTFLMKCIREIPDVERLLGPATPAMAGGQGLVPDPNDDDNDAGALQAEALPADL